MSTDTLSQIQELLMGLEQKMVEGNEKKKSLLKSFIPSNTRQLKTYIHYLTLRNEDIRELQDIAVYLWSFFPSKFRKPYPQASTIHSGTTRAKISGGRNRYLHVMISAAARLNKEAKYFLAKRQYPLTPYIMVTFDSSFADNYA